MPVGTGQGPGDCFHSHNDVYSKIFRFLSFISSKSHKTVKMQVKK